MEKWIILDFDDVVVEFTEDCCNKFNEKYSTHITPSQITKWDMKEERMLTHEGWVSGQLYDSFISEYVFSGAFKKIPLTKNAKETLVLLKKQGFKIAVLTARSKTQIENTKTYIKEHKLPVDRLIFAKDKLGKLKELSQEIEIAAYVEDNPEYLIEVGKSNLPTFFLFVVDRAHNKEEIPGTIRIQQLMEILKYL